MSASATFHSAGLAVATTGAVASVVAHDIRAKPRDKDDSAAVTMCFMAQQIGRVAVRVEPLG